MEGLITIITCTLIIAIIGISMVIEMLENRLDTEISELKRIVEEMKRGLERYE